MCWNLRISEERLYWGNKLEAKDYIKRFGTLKSARSLWESHWQEIAELVYSQRSDFTGENTPGAKLNLKRYDSTAEQANQLLASSLHGMLTNPASEWFTLRVVDEELSENKDIKEWLDEVVKRMFAAINSPKAAFATNMHEVYLEWGAFGMAPLYVTENNNLDGILFQARPLSECYIAENEDGIVDTVYRQFKWTVRQVAQEWGPGNVSEKTRKLFNENKWDEKIKIIHAVQPRKDFRKDKIDRANKPVASVYIEVETKYILEEGGYDEMPYMTPRFYKAPSETYGRSPGTTALPDVRMINKMMQTTIRAAQKVVDPPLLVEDDGVVGPMRTVPGGISFFRKNSEKPEALNTGGKIELGMDLIDRVRDSIRSAWFVDQLQLSEGPNMTATEVLQRTEEKLRLMGPILGRLQSELLGPMIDRVFAIMLRAGSFPDIPEHLSGAELKTEYVSPIARAQKQLEAQGVGRLVEIMSPFVQFDPSIMDRFDGDKALTRFADLYGVSPTLLKDDEEVEEVREQRNQMAQLQQGVALAKDGGSALKDISQAVRQ